MERRLLSSRVRGSGVGVLRMAAPLCAIVTILLLAVMVGTASAQEGPRPVTDDEVNDVAKDLFCPVCESTPLDVCPTQACADWREVIRTKLSEGQSAADIRAYFAEQYGTRALAEPPREGFTLAVWILPIVAVIIGAFVFSRYLVGLRTGGQAAKFSGTQAGSPGESKPTADGAQSLDDYAARIERELGEM